MSQFTKQHPTKPLEIQYGLDNYLGWFYTIYTLEPEDEDDNVIENKSTKFDRLHRGTLIDQLEEFDADEFHIHRIAMDLDPQP
jgi:acyl transferase domain-containing protein